VDAYVTMNVEDREKAAVNAHRAHMLRLSQESARVRRIKAQVKAEAAAKALDPQRPGDGESPAE
jgi:hypothetical protein